MSSLPSNLTCLVCAGASRAERCVLTAPPAPAPSPADDADPAGEVLPGEDAGDAEPASLEGEDGDDAAALRARAAR